MLLGITRSFVATDQPRRNGRYVADDTLLKAFGARVRALRSDGDLTQEALAAACDLSPTYIGYIEKGHRNPSLKVIHQLAEGLRVTPAKLVGD